MSLLVVVVVIIIIIIIIIIMTYSYKVQNPTIVAQCGDVGLGPTDGKNVS